MIAKNAVKSIDWTVKQRVLFQTQHYFYIVSTEDKNTNVKSVKVASYALTVEKGLNAKSVEVSASALMAYKRVSARTVAATRYAIMADISLDANNAKS